MAKPFCRVIILAAALCFANSMQSGMAWAQTINAAPSAPAAESAPASAPALAPAPAPVAAPAPAVQEQVPENLSPWGMFLGADIVVKGVICLLALAVVLTWTIWLVKTYELARARYRLTRDFRLLCEARSMAQAEEALGGGNGAAQALMAAALEEWQHSTDVLDDRDGLKERIALHLERAEATLGRRLISGTGLLATIGATAPFVGLFGTVWGIMNSFVGISKLHTTNLAVVAPGIAEALLATACGLIAAIPAVVIYNHFTRRIGACKAQLADAGSAVMRLVSRDLSRGTREDGGHFTALRMVAE